VGGVGAEGCSPVAGSSAHDYQQWRTAWRHFSPLQGLIARFGCASLVDESFGVESLISKRADVRHVQSNGQERATRTDRPIAARLFTLVLQNAACMNLSGKLGDSGEILGKIKPRSTSLPLPASQERVPHSRLSSTAITAAGMP
jgi:hypothetical protein